MIKPIYIKYLSFLTIVITSISCTSEQIEKSHKIHLPENMQGVLAKGEAIRENYHPRTGEGLNAYNLSRSAAHIIMLLQNEE